MAARSSIGDALFLRSFESGDVSPSDFNHRGHLRLAYTYLCEYDVDSAYAKMKISIQSFLHRNNIDADNYHETMTKAWVQAVRHFIEMAGDTESFEEFIVFDKRLLDTEIMLSHYSRERLFSSHARSRYLPPDLQAIPSY